MVKTRVGYCGGDKAHPSYRSIGDHSEAVQVDYDYDVLHYEDVLELFWENHEPSVEMSRQYASKIFYASEGQRRSAEASKAKREQLLGRPVFTTIEPLRKFHKAERYHQHYIAKQRRGAGQFCLLL